MAVLWRFFQRFLRYRSTLLLGFVCIPLAQLADLWITITIGNALNEAQSAPDVSYMPRVAALLVAVAVGHSIFRFFQRWWIVVVSRRVEVDLKQELFDKLTELDFSFHDRSRSGDVVSRLTSDVENLRMFLGPGMMYSAGALVIIPISLFILFTINATMAVTMVLPMLGVALAMKLLSPRLQRFSIAVQESLAEISHRAQENFSGIRVVKGYHCDGQQAGLFDATSNDNRTNQVELGKARGLTHAFINGSFDLTFAVILLIGGLAAIDRSLPIGDLFKFIDLTLKIFWPLIAMGWIAGIYPRAIASGVRVEELLGQTSLITDPESPETLDDVRGDIEFRGVGFTYEGTRAPALSDISGSVRAGGTLGIVGPTGSGKTTLLNLVGRLYDAQEGAVLLDGMNVCALRLQDLRGALGYVPQDSFLFSEPYHENIRFGADGELSTARVEQLIDQAAMQGEVAEFPDGLETLVGERGVTLSGGQRQRTCIARALARDPRVLILDDCLSAVDTETERALLAHLRDARAGRTVLVAAHRLTMVAEADQILVLARDGHIEAKGTHEELLRSPGWYSMTWEQQQRQAAEELEP